MTPKRLTKERILEAAAEAIEDVGAAKFSMRKLAARLGVDAMAVYYYFPNKRTVLHEVLQHSMSRIRIDVRGDNWKQDFASICHGVRDFALAHPEIFLVYSDHDLWLLPEHDLFEAFYSVLLSAGLSEDQAVQSTRFTLVFLEEFCFSEATDWHNLGTEEEYIDSLDNRPYPLLRRMATKTITMDGDQDFEFGIQVMISGIEAFCLT